ncbi:MAG: tetratricopeptide repeat protein [Casimicrobiaceae bacterium]
MTANYKFGRFELSPDTRQLLVDDQPAPLGERAFDVLLALIERRERLVTKEELLDLAWPGLVVEENNLQVQVSALRKILGTDAIATIARRGYRFTLQVGSEALSHPTQSLETLPAADVADKPSIAVLPFVNTSDDAANEYFADGLAEELLNVLSKIRGLRVASRTSAFSFKGGNVDIPTMAQKLNVATILEGSVRKAGNRVRINAQLIHVATDSHLWSATYDRQLEDIFAVQDDIAQSVVKELRAALMGDEPDSASSAAVRAEIEAAARGRGENAEAYRLYMQANFHNDRLTVEDFAIAIEAYRAALKVDPSYALAWAGLSIAYANGTGQGWLGTDLDEGFRLAREAAGKAMQLDPDLAESHEALGVIQYANQWDWKGAEASFARALELAPHSIRIMRHTMFILHARGRYDEAIALLRRAVELDPLSGTVYCFLAGSYRIAGRLDRAETAIRKSLELSPHGGFGHYNLSDVCLAQGRLDEALEEAKRETHKMFRLFALAKVYHAQGRHTESDAALEELINTYADTAAFQIAEIFAYRDQRDEAFAWLERACAQRDAGMIFVRASPSMRGLHRDPRWRPFVEKVGLAD